MAKNTAPVIVDPTPEVKQEKDLLKIEVIPKDLFEMFIEFIIDKKQHYSTNIIKEFAKMQSMYNKIKK